MKKIFILIATIIVLFGCTSKKCSDNELINDFNIKINGLYTMSLTNKNLSNIKLETINVNETNPFYTVSNLYKGYKVKDIFKELKISTYDFVRFINDTTTKKYSNNNIDDNTYLVFYKDNKLLKKPMFIKSTISNVYWINNLSEITFSKDF